jgi:hypothetical protein
MEMLTGVFAFVVFLVLGTVLVLVITLAGVGAVAVGLLLTPVATVVLAPAVALGLLLRHMASRRAGRESDAREEKPRPVPAARPPEPPAPAAPAKRVA